MDHILHQLSERIDEWEQAEVLHAEKDATFKALEAAKKKALMDGKKLSATAADIEFRADPEWAAVYMEVQTAKIKAEALKKRIQLGQAYFDAERSRYSATRKAVG